MPTESAATVRLAFVANLLIAAAKTAAGLLSGSSSMISEAAHSWADTMNEVFLIASLKRSRRPADAVHPFGYGKERFFWSLLAAVGIFVTGGLFSLWQGFQALREGHHEIGSFEAYLSYGVLAFAVVMEGSSLLRARKQVAQEAKRADRSFADQVRYGDDPSVKTVLSEDSLAVAGLVLATLGLTLHRLTGSAVYDGAASMAIGVLLVVVAYLLGRDTKDLLIGEAADPRTRADIFTQVLAMAEIDAVLELLTMKLGPDELLVAMKVDLADELTASEVEELSNRIDADLRDRFPTVRQVFVDATAPSGPQQTLVETVRSLGGDDEAAVPISRAPTSS